MKTAVKRTQRLTAVLLHCFVVVAASSGSVPPADDWTLAMREALEGAVRLRVRPARTSDDDAAGNGKPLIELEDQVEVAGFIEKIQIANPDAPFLDDCGELTFEFYRDHSRIASLDFYGRRYLRFTTGQWRVVTLTEASRIFVLDWLARHGVTAPQAEENNWLRACKQAEEALAKWCAAMPSSLKPFWDRIASPILRRKSMPPHEPLDPKIVQEMRAALCREYPDPVQRISALLEWYGSGDGPWCEFPAYERFAEALLLSHEIDSLMTTLRGAVLTSQQMEGASRLLFGTPALAHQIDGLLARMPEPLRRRFLEHGMVIPYKENRDRVLKVFLRTQEKNDPTTASSEPSSAGAPEGRSR